jgi:hypothetical protein
VPTCGTIVPIFILEFCFINVDAFDTKVLNEFVKVVNEFYKFVIVVAWLFTVLDKF